MTREEAFIKLTEVFKDVFYDDEITISDETVSNDIEGWDSLMHITLIGAIEDEFEIKFAMRDVVTMKNVGALVDKILELVED